MKNVLQIAGISCVRSHKWLICWKSQQAYSAGRNFHFSGLNLIANYRVTWSFFLHCGIAGFPRLNKFCRMSGKWSVECSGWYLRHPAKWQTNKRKTKVAKPLVLSLSSSRLKKITTEIIRSGTSTCMCHRPKKSKKKRNLLNSKALVQTWPYFKTSGIKTYQSLLLSNDAARKERNPQKNSANLWLTPARCGPEHSAE